MNTCRIAVIGAGVIGRAHLATIASCRGLARAVALVDPSPAAAVVASDAGLPLYRDTETLLAEERFDAAIVASPNSTHVDIASMLVRKGIPVLVEKPVAATAAEAGALADLSRQLGVPVLVGHHRRHNPVVQAARGLIQSGAIGQLVVASVIGVVMKDEGYHDVEWRKRPGSGGPLLINMIHEVDLLRYLFGDINEVQALTSSIQRGLPVEDTAVASVRFASGALASFTVSDAAVSPWSWDLTAGESPRRFPTLPASAHHYCGTEGALSLPDLRLWRYKDEKSWYRPIENETQFTRGGDPYIAQLEHFVDVVVCGNKPLITVSDAMHSLACVEAMLLSANKGVGAVSPSAMLKVEESST